MPVSIKPGSGYDFVVSGGGGPASALVPPTAPANQSVSSSTTSVSLTWTAAASGGTSPYAYALAVKDETGASVTPSSGSGLGPYAIPVAQGKSYVATLTATDSGTPALSASSSTLVEVQQSDLVAPVAPAPQALAAGTTTVDLTWTAASAGSPPYSYNITVVDDAGSSVIPSAGSGLGPYTIPLADGKSYLATLSASDNGVPTQVASSSTLVQVAAPAVANMDPATAPAVSNPVSGTTSVNLTWTGGASGGVSPYTYAITVVDQSGSAVTPSSGSGLGPYAIPVADGNSYLATLTATDSAGTPNTAASSTMVQVGTPAPAPAWNLLTDVKLTGLDTLDISAVGTYTLTKGGVPFKDIRISRTGSTGATNTADLTGVLLDGPTAVAGTYQAAIDETAAVSLTGASTLVAADLASPIALQMQCTLLESSGVSGNGCFAGMASNTNVPITSTIYQGIRLDSDGTNFDLDARVYRGSATDAPWVANIAPLGTQQALVTVILHYGNVAELWVDWGSSSYVTPRAENTGPAQAGGNVSTGPGFISSYNLFTVAFGVVKATSGTFRIKLAGYRIYRYG